MESHPGWMLVILGLVIAAGGLIWIFAPGVPWLGHLPGDIHFETDAMQIYIPITTCILLSLLLTAIAWAVRWFSR